MNARNTMLSDVTGSNLTALLLLILPTLTTCATRALAMNPVLPGTAFIPDSQPYVYEYKGEKRVFVYGSRDERVTAFCGYGLDTWSAPIHDLTHWTNHGEIFNVKQVQDIGFGKVAEQHFGASCCAYNPVDKKYYLYTFLGMIYRTNGIEGPAVGSANYIPGFGEHGPKAVVASSDSPAGPFTQPAMCDWPPGNDAGAFDPGVLVDQQPDGSVRAYAYWGLRGGDRWAELDPRDMHTIIDPKTRKPDRNAWQKTLPPKEAFQGSTLFEASSIRKVADGKYVYIYSSQERHSALTYCYSNAPQGPWNFGGRIVDNSIGWNGGNGHGGIVHVEGQWYVFYHRATCNDYNRQMMAEPIRILIDGGRVEIPAVQMSSEGVENAGLDAFRRYNAAIICYSSRPVQIDGKQRNPDGLNPLTGLKEPGLILGIKHLNFGSTAVRDSDQLKLKLNVRISKETNLALKVATPLLVDDVKDRVEIAKFDLQTYVKADGNFHEAVIPITGLDAASSLQAMGGLRGKLAVYLAFAGPSDGCELKEIEFAKGDAPTPNPLREVSTGSAILPGGKVVALPNAGRPGDSIKLTVLPEAGYVLDDLRVLDASGALVRCSQNAATPHAPLSFSFAMPATAVQVAARFKPE